MSHDGPPAQRQTGVVLITGGGTGIGRAAALLLVKHSAAVAVMGRRPAPLETVVREVTGDGGRALALPADVTRQDDVASAVARTLEAFGRIDVLVNNAGTAAPAALLHETQDEDWREMIDTHLTGAFRMTRAVLPHFIERGRGVIVNVSSIAAMVGMPRMSAYAAAKSGLIALTRSVAVEYGPLGIRCNCICPGTVLTPMTEGCLDHEDRRRRVVGCIPLGRVAEPSEVARAILYLGSDASSFANGAVLPLDGGYTARWDRHPGKAGSKGRP